MHGSVPHHEFPSTTQPRGGLTGPWHGRCWRALTTEIISTFRIDELASRFAGRPASNVAALSASSGLGRYAASLRSIIRGQDGHGLTIHQIPDQHSFPARH